MKPYLVAAEKINSHFTSQPNHSNFETAEWRNFIKEICQIKPNHAVRMLKKRIPAFIDYVNGKYHDGTISEKIVWYYDGVKKCLECNAKTKLINIKYGFRRYCSNSCLMKSQLHWDKLKQINIEKFGSEFPLQSKKIQEKITQNNLVKYGVENVFQLEEVKDKIKKTHIENYGVDNIAKALEVKAKIVKTNLEKYGVEHGLSAPNVKAKIVKTNLEKYGVENVMQVSSILEKSLKNAKKIKTCVVGGIEISYQGYEDVMIKYLFQIYNCFENIMVHSEIPTFNYILNSKNKKYFPDILDKNSNTIYEIKSSWTFNSYNHFEELLAKRQAVLSAGYHFIIAICSKIKILNLLSTEEEIYEYYYKNKKN